MKRAVIHFLAVVVMIISFGLQAQSANSQLKAPHVQIQLISSNRSVATGDQFWLGFVFRLDPHWHIYWKNPGDSGAAPKFHNLSSEIRLEEVQWPVPRRIPFGPLTNIGYEGEVVFPVRAHVLTRENNKVRLKFKLEWLVCREECVPGFGELEMNLPLGISEIQPTEAEILSKARSRIPQPMLVQNLKQEPSLRILQPGEVELSWKIDPAVSTSVVDLMNVFPVDGESYAAAEPRKIHDEQLLKWIFKVSNSESRRIDQFVVEDGLGGAVEVDLTVPAAAMETPDTNFWFLILSAFLGGMILNLMPCVFPVLSIKVFTFMKAHEGDRSALIKDGLFYSLGTLLTFGALGILFLLVRQGGAAVGWGFQLQSPLVIYILASLFFGISLSFLGLFEVGTLLMNWAGLRMNQKGWTSAFGTGILSVLVAAPCTGPYMGVALGAAVLLPPIAAMMIFLAMGMGLAFPLLMLCLFPGWLRRLPRSGAWMNTLKELFAFPLLATVIWLLWILTQQGGADALLWAGIGFWFFSLAIWFFLRKSVRRGLICLVIGLTLPCWKLMNLESVDSPQGSSHVQGWQPFHPEELSEMLAKKQAVFIDFTAAWCITCQWNKKAVLETTEIENLFLERNVKLIRADWTKQDPQITQALAKFGRASVPLYVYYPPQGEPVILPQILTAEMIKNLF